MTQPEPVVFRGGARALGVGAPERPLRAVKGRSRGSPGRRWTGGPDPGTGCEVAGLLSGVEPAENRPEAESAKYPFPEFVGEALETADGSDPPREK